MASAGCRGQSAALASHWSVGEQEVTRHIGHHGDIRGNIHLSSSPHLSLGQIICQIVEQFVEDFEPGEVAVQEGTHTHKHNTHTLTHTHTVTTHTHKIGRAHV